MIAQNFNSSQVKTYYAIMLMKLMPKSDKLTSDLLVKIMSVPC